MTSYNHMHKIIFAALCLGALLSITVMAESSPAASASIGQPAPDFTLQGADGKTHSLADYKGKFVVLEWTNPNCPFVHKFYDSNTMQTLQKTETGKGVVWLRINSAATGKDDYQTASDMAAYVKSHNVAATESLIDADGNKLGIYRRPKTGKVTAREPANAWGSRLCVCCLNV